MKRKIFILSAIAALCTLVAGCTDEVKSNQLDSLKLSNTYVSIDPAGGSNTVTVTATGPWQFVDDHGINAIPDWLTVEPTSGNAGTTTVTFTGTGSEAYRLAKLKIKIGDQEQYINVAQGTDAASAVKIAEALTGPDGRKLELTGAVTGWYSNAEKYGNFYITDNTGTILIYGLADKDGKFANEPLKSWGIELGDVVTIVGPRGNYKGDPQMVDVTLVKLVKSLIQIVGTEEGNIPQEGGEKEIRMVCKGGGPTVTIPEADQAWLSVSDIRMIPGVPDPQFPTVTVPDTAVVSMKAIANEGGARTSVVAFGSTSGEESSSVSVEIVQDGSIREITAAEFNAKPDGSALFKITGTVEDIVMDKNDPTKYNAYGNFYIKDATGRIYVYGLLPEAGGATKQDVLTQKGIKAGDIITVVGPKSSHNGNPQMVNAYYVSHTSIKVATVAEVGTGADGEIFQVTGKITGWYGKEANALKYGNYNIQDETGTLIIYGTADKEGKLANNPIDSWGIEIGDEITVKGEKSTFNGTPQLKNVTVVDLKKGSGGGEEPQPEIKEVSIADFLSAAVGDDVYRLTGIVMEGYASDKSGESFYIQDWSGKTLGYKVGGFKDSGAKVGDVVTISGKRGAFNGNAQMVSGTFEKINHAVTEVSIADFLKKEDSKTVFYMVTGTVKSLKDNKGKDNVYGNMYITDGTNDLYVYGTYPGWGATGDDRKNVVTDKGIEVGDQITLIGYKDTFNDLVEICTCSLFSHTKK